MFKKIAIIGVGLMGASLGWAVKKKKIAGQVWGYARRRESLEKIKCLRVVDKVSLSLKEVVYGSDLVVLSLPVKVTIAFFNKIRPFLSKESLVIDLGSTKKEINRAAKEIIPHINFTGCHPLCGTEKSGAQFFQKDLYSNAVCIVTKPQSKAKKVFLFWKRIGAKPVYLNAAYHDKVIAYTSHLPHLLSFSLANTLDEKYSSYSAGSLKDMLRVANSKAFLWQEIFSSNKKEIIKAAEKYKREIDKFLFSLRGGNSRKTAKLIQQANKKAADII